jgi:hypothetical protein
MKTELLKSSILFACTCLISAVCVLFYPINTYAAGEMSGGGGLAVVCRGFFGGIKTIETLDLFEAREIYKLKTKPVDQNLEVAISNLKKQLTFTMEQPEFHLIPKIDGVQKIMKYIDKNIALEPTNDGAILGLPKGCKIEQLATYVDNELLIVNKKYWNKLDTKNQLALILHEAVYKLDRYDDAKDSRRTRKLVGHILSDKTLKSVTS